MKRAKKEYPNDFRTKAGFFTISWIHGFATVVFSLFMQFLTDYSGIDEAVGKVGFAAALGTVLLLVTRIVDAVDDPLQGWIMDSAKECKFGKYRKFTLWSIIMCGSGIAIMFSIPQVIKSTPVFLAIWVFVGYLLYEMGYAFNGTSALIQKSTYDPNVRSKLTSLLRMGIILSVVPASFFIPIATAVNGPIGNMGKAFSLTCIGVTIFSCVLSFAGTMCVKEPYRPISMEEGTENGGKISVKEIWGMLKTNKPLWVTAIANFVNIGYAISTAVLVYFLKWFYCADMATGAVDEIRYASIYAIYGAISIIPAFLTPLIASWVVRKFGTIDRAARGLVLTQGVIMGVIFVLYVLGILQMNPMIYIVLIFLSAIPANLAVIPSSLMWTECADYAEYMTGKNMTALVNAVNNVLAKAQTAISTVLPGILLIVVGYSVNSETGAYAGDLTKLPSMVRNITLMNTLVPMVVCIVSWAIFKFFYPITQETREKMTSELISKHEEEQKQTKSQS